MENTQINVEEHAAKFQKVFGNRVLILPQEMKESVSTGGIIIRADAKKKNMCGTVIMTGPGLQNTDGSFIPMTVKPGDQILYNKFTAYELTEDSIDYVIVQEDDILAIDTEGELILQLKAGLL